MSDTESVFQRFFDEAKERVGEANRLYPEHVWEARFTNSPDGTGVIAKCKRCKSEFRGKHTREQPLASCDLQFVSEVMDS